MSEFLHFVIWELRRYSVLALLAGFAAMGLLVIVRCMFLRKYGKEKDFSWMRAILIVVFTGYLAIVFLATNFRASHMNREVNLHLFRAWREALNNFSQHRWLNVLLNIAMFCPFGFLLPILDGRFRKWHLIIPTGFGFSLVIELLQLIFARGIFDVDDLFCNTLGAVVGYFVIMVFLSARNEKGKRMKPVLAYTCMTLLSLGAVGSVFLAYRTKEFGNLPQAPVYTVDTLGTVWTLECELPAAKETAAVYRTEIRTGEDCDAFAEIFRKLIPTEFEDISYYQEAAYYMDHGNGDGAHFLFVHYLDQGYEYSAIYEDEPLWAEADRETVLRALERYPLSIPENAEFSVLGDGWHSFLANQQVDQDVLYDGTLRVRMAHDGSIREIQNGLLSYGYYRDVDVISPEEALKRLQAGKFNDGGYFDHTDPREVAVLSCELEYRVDTKGFYQPVYVFEVASSDEGYYCRIPIPAIK